MSSSSASADSILYPKHALRKLEFPFCAREALSRIEQLCTQPGGPVFNVRQADLASELINEFIFCEMDRRGGKRRKLTCIQELQLLEVLCDYLSYPGGNEATRNAVFMSLFPGSHPERSRLLVKLVSMAISTNNSPVLMATAILMQQLSCTSKFSIQLANGLVNDYFVLVPKSVDRLKELPKIAPLFTANFLTAVTEMYGCTYIDKNEGLEWKGPPISLLEVITEWVSEQRSLCLTALTVDLQPALPSGGIPMPAITPYAGLFKWTVLSSLHETDKRALELYMDLHLALLESLLECIPLAAKRPEHIISAQHLAAIIPQIVDSNFPESDERLCKAIDRLGQAVQMALHTKSVYGNKQELIKQLETLPKNRLMIMVLRAHREVI